MAWLFSGLAISARYFLMNAAHWGGVLASRAIFMVSRLGARLGNQTSYQFRDENSALGTPRGGRRTVPMRVPSPSTRGLPSLITRTTMAGSLDGARLWPREANRAPAVHKTSFTVLNMRPLSASV